MAKQGQNVWYDLMTPDVEGAKRFYGQVVGWTTKSWAEADPSRPYTMWKSGERPIGGVIEIPKGGMPPHWIAYTSVDDVDGACAKATQLGGSIVKPAWDIPKVGRLAILADPQGAVFSVFKSVEDRPAEEANRPGLFSWAELNTTDYEGAWAFYSALFGWEHRSSMDMGPGVGTYLMFQDPDKLTRGGMSNVAKQMKVPPHWLYYVNVADMNVAVDTIKAGGGKVMNGPMQIPPSDLIAQCVDPQGAFFAIYQEGQR